MTCMLFVLIFWHINVLIIKHVEWTIYLQNNKFYVMNCLLKIIVSQCIAGQLLVTITFVVEDCTRKGDLISMYILISWTENVGESYRVST